MDSIRKFRSSIHSWKFATIAITIIGGRGVRDNKGENQLLIVNGKGVFDQNVFVLGNNFILKCEQLFVTYNGSQYIVILIKNVTTTTKGD
jgi:hypothetical protein